jgi:deoxyhypusine synthase
MKRIALILLLTLGCAIPKEFTHQNVYLRDSAIYLTNTNIKIGEVTGVDYAHYSAGIIRSYHITILSGEYKSYEKEIVSLILRTQKGAVETHISYR